MLNFKTALNKILKFIKSVPTARHVKKAIFKKGGFRDLLLEQTILQHGDFDDHDVTDLVLSAFKVSCWFTNLALADCDGFSKAELDRQSMTLSRRIEDALLNEKLDFKQFLPSEPK